MGYRVFRTTYTDHNGKTRQAAKWYVEFRDHNERPRRLPAFASKAASEETGRNLVRLVDYHKATGGQTDPALSRWLTTLPRRTRDKLVSIGLLSPERVAVSKPLADHLTDFAAALRAKGNSDFHVEVVTGRARRVFNGCGFRYFSDLDAGKVLAFLSGLRADKGEKRGISAQTFNFYVGAVKQFCRWMVKDRRAAESPVAHLDGVNVKTDRRRDRRALTVDELVRLLDATRAGRDRAGMTGPERAMLYRLAVETGLRSNELRSLTRAAFDLDADTPTVTVEAAYSKRRRQDTLPLRPELAAELRGFLAAKAPAAAAFRISSKRRTAARMFRLDVEAAGIPYRDDVGRVADFHALRHTFITNLANGGVHPKTAQALARHSTITLTMDRYSHTLMEEQSTALAALPDLTKPARPAIRATGTAGPESADPRLALCLARQGRPMGISVDPGGQSAGRSDKATSATEPLAVQGGNAASVRDGSVWESNPQRALFKPSTGFEDQGPHQRCKHSQGMLSR